MSKYDILLKSLLSGLVVETGNIPLVAGVLGLLKSLLSGLVVETCWRWRRGAADRPVEKPAQRLGS